MVAVTIAQQIAHNVLQQQVALHVLVDITYTKKAVLINAQMVLLQSMENVNHACLVVEDVVPKVLVHNVMKINSLLMKNVLMFVQREPIQEQQLREINAYHVIRAAKLVMVQIHAQNAH